MNWFVYYFLVTLMLILYFLVPLIRSILVRIYWRKIRRLIVHSKTATKVKYGYSYNDDQLKIMYGRFGGFSSKNQLWIENQECLVMAKARNRFCFYLPSKVGDPNHFKLKEKPSTMESVFVPHLEQFSASLSKPQVMAIGKIKKRENQMAYIDAKFLVFYEGEESQVQDRVIAASFPPYTLISLFNIFCYSFSSLLFFMLAYIIFVRYNFSDKLSVVLAISFALIPIFLFIPPALIFLYLYRQSEKQLRKNLYTIYTDRINSTLDRCKTKLAIRRIALYVFEGLFLLLAYLLAFVTAFFLCRFLMG